MTDQAEKKHSAFRGVMVIADTVTGRSMLALPVDLAGAWFFWGALILIIIWLSMLHSELLLPEANLSYPAGSNFSTVTKDLIDNTWNIIGDITIAFVLYILTYTYISANGTIINGTISMNLGYHANPRIVGICTAIFVASVLWISSLATNRTISLFLGLKIISFVIVFGSLLFQVDYFVLRDVTSTTARTSYFPYIFVALPVYLASSGSYGNIPSLIICYGKRKDKLIKDVVFDSPLALVIYLLQLYCTMGNIPRESFGTIISSDDSVDSLMKSLLGIKQHGIIESRLLVFSNSAVVSSSFGVTLGLFDHLANLFKIDNSHDGCFKTVLSTFLLPALLYLIFPSGFIYGIGGAGLCATIQTVIISAVLTIRARKKSPNQMFMAWGGNLIPAVVTLFGTIMVLCQLSSVSNVLPKFG